MILMLQLSESLQVWPPFRSIATRFSYMQRHEGSISKCSQGVFLWEHLGLQPWLV